MSGDIRGLGAIGPGSLVAGYRIESQLGSGGMAVVYRARDGRLGRMVALKVMAPHWAEDEEFRLRFIGESRAAAAVDDPYVIPVYEAGEDNGLLYIAMRLVDGPDLGEIIRREENMTPSRALELLTPVASALDSAHEAGLIHRDVKPANILVNQRPGRPDHVYLSDFGLSKLAVSASSAAGLTGTGRFIGTPQYASPEHAKGEPLDGRSDQYALACVAYHMLTGHIPFERNDGLTILLAHMTAPPPSATGLRPDLPAAADPVLVRALAKCPGDRYPTCRDFTEALRAALTPQTASANGQASVQPDAHVPTLRVAASPPSPVPPRPLYPPPGGFPVGSYVPTVKTPVRKPTRLKGKRAILSAGGLLAIAGAATAGLILSHPAAGSPPIGKPALLAKVSDPSDSSTYGVAFSPDARNFADFDEDGDAYLWDFASHKIIAVIAGASSDYSVTALAFSPDGKTIAFGDGDTGNVYLWDVTTRKVVGSLPGQSGDAPESVSFSSDGHTLVVGEDNGGLSLWDTASGRLSRSFTNPGSGSSSSDGVDARFSPDGSSIASVYNGNLYLWNIADKKVSATFTDSGNSDLNDASFSPDGNTIALAGDENAFLWSVDTHKVTATFADPGEQTMDVASFSPAGRYAAVTGDDGATYLWDSTTRKIAAALRDPSADASVYAAAFSPDGRDVVMGDDSGEISVWRVSGA